MIDLVGLRSLVALERHGTVLATADALGYTPSAVSQQLKKLEAAAGVQLLERFGRRVILTAPGRVLVDSATDVLTRLEQIEADLQSLAVRPAGLLRLGAFATAVRGLLAPMLGDLQRRHPPVTVRSSEVEPWDGVELVAAGRLDLAVVHNWEPVPLVLPANLQSSTLGFDRADVLLHRDDPLAGRDGLIAAELTDRSWVSVPPGSICHQWLTWMFQEHGTVPRITQYCTEFASHVDLVAHGLATALVPRLGRGVLPDTVAAVPLTDPVPLRRVTAVWRRTMTASPAVAAVVQALRITAADVLTEGVLR